MQQLLDAINRLKAALELSERLDDLETLKDMCDMLEGLIPGFVSPFPPQVPHAGERSVE